MWVPGDEVPCLRPARFGQRSSHRLQQAPRRQPGHPGHPWGGEVPCRKGRGSSPGMTAGETPGNGAGRAGGAADRGRSQLGRAGGAGLPGTCGLGEERGQAGGTHAGRRAERPPSRAPPVAPGCPAAPGHGLGPAARVASLPGASAERVTPRRGTSPLPVPGAAPLPHPPLPPRGRAPAEAGPEMRAPVRAARPRRGPRPGPAAPAPRNRRRRRARSLRGSRYRRRRTWLRRRAAAP